MSRKVVAVVPVYRPPADFVETVSLLTAQVDAIVLVDDGSHTLDDLALESDTVATISLAENSGIAAALNAAVARAVELGATYIVTLDQDSRLVDGHVERLIALIEQARSQGRRVVGAVPGIVGGAPVLRFADGSPFDPIQSGQVVPVDVLRQLGPFTEELFIDAVDSDFTVRAHDAGFVFLIADDLEMAHSLGEAVPLSVFGRPLVLGGKQRHVLYHSPMRTYYMVRNSRWLSRTYGVRDRAWMRLRNRKMFELVAGCTILAPDRLLQLRAVRAGLRDGKRGTLGKISPELQRKLSPR